MRVVKYAPVNDADCDSVDPSGCRVPPYAAATVTPAARLITLSRRGRARGDISD